MQPKRLVYGLARVRIAGTDLTGDEILIAPPYYERHIFVKEYSQQGHLRWHTYRPILGRELVIPSPQDIPIRYKMLVHEVDEQGNRTIESAELGIGFPKFTGMFVGNPINAYVPIPLIGYVASPLDQYPVSKYGFYPNVTPYAIPVYTTDTQSTPGFFKVESKPQEVAANIPFSFSFEETGLVFRGSMAVIYPVTNLHIPREIIVRGARRGLGGSVTQRWEERFAFVQETISWRDVVLYGSEALNKLKRTLYSKSLAENSIENVGTSTIADDRTELIDGRLVGVYVDWHSAGSLRITNDMKDFTFGFYVVPMAPVFQETAAITKLSTIRIFWGGYYMIEILPNATNFYFFKDGYSVPADPTIPTHVLLPSRNEIYRNAQRYGGIYTYIFSLKYLRPVVNGAPFPPNVFFQPIPSMSFSWGSRGLQAAGRYDTYIIMHLRSHVCIFSYNSILRAAMTGSKVEPLFAFNPLEYIYRHFGAEEAKRWWRQNGYAIARADSPPKMWLFNVSSYVMLPYMEYADTAIATKPSFITPSNPQLIVDPSHFQYIKVAPSGIFMRGTVGAREADVREIPTVLSLYDPIPPELSTQPAMIYGDEVAPVYQPLPNDITLTRGAYRAFARASPDPNFVGMRIYAIPSPSPDYPFIVEHVDIGNEVKRYLIGEVSGTTPQGILRREDILMSSVVFRTPVSDRLSGQTYWGEISGFYPSPYERSQGAIPLPTFDGEKGPFIDYLNKSVRREVTVAVSPLLPRPPVFIGADIFRLPIVAASKTAPPSISFIAPAPRHSSIDTGVESVSVTLTDSVGGNNATIKVVVDESVLDRWGEKQPQPIETIATGLIVEPSSISSPTEIPYPSKLLYRRMLIECGYIVETPSGEIEGVLYPVFDGIVTGVTVSGTRETASGRQVELVIRGADIFTRLKWVPSTGKDPILDNWTPAAFAAWALAACGLSPLRVKGISGLPLGAPLTWWLGNERVVAPELLGGYGFPLQNIPESPRVEVGVGSSLGDILERYAGISGCEIISIPSPSVLSFLNANLNIIWRHYLTSAEYRQFLTPAHEYINQSVLDEIGGFGNYWWGVPWRSTLGIIPAGFYSPIPSWTLMVGPGDYTTPSVVLPSGEESLYRITVPEAPFTRGLLEISVEEGIWNLPTQVTVEGLTLFRVPFYYIWADVNREVNPFAWYYGGFRIPRFITSPDIVTVQQAKLAALRAYFSGRLFPPKTMKASLSVGLPFLYPRQTVRLVTSSALYNIPPIGRSLWVIRAVTHTWEAGDTPKTVLDLSVPHWFPIGIPTG